MINNTASELFGCHVDRRAEAVLRGSMAGVTWGSCNTEICDLRGLAGIEKNVRRFEVAMDDRPFMHGDESLGDFGGNPACLIFRKAILLLQTIRETLREVFESEVRADVLIDSDIPNLDNVWVVKFRENATFVEKPG